MTKPVSKDRTKSHIRLFLLALALVLILGKVVDTINREVKTYRRTRALLDADIQGSPACWKGICPGVTTQEEAIELLESYDDTKDIMSRIDYNEPNPAIRVYYSDLLRAKITLKDGVVDHICLYGTVRLLAITDSLGDPDFVAVAYYDAPDSPDKIVLLGYPDKGLTISCRQFLLKQARIYPNTMFRNIYLSPPERVGEWPFYWGVKQPTEGAAAWHGYGLYPITTKPRWWDERPEPTARP